MILDLRKLKPKNTIKRKSKGIKNISIKIFPNKLNKDLNPKIGTITRIIDDEISNFLFI